jgi:hypothetical protein
MQTSYIRFGRRYSIPSTAQVLDELKSGYVAGYVPISQGYKKLRRTKQRLTAMATHEEQTPELDRWENEGGALRSRKDDANQTSASRGGPGTRPAINPRRAQPNPLPAAIPASAPKEIR